MFYFINPSVYIKYYLALKINSLRLPAVIGEHSVNPIEIRCDSVVGTGEGRVASGVNAADHPRRGSQDVPFR